MLRGAILLLPLPPSLPRSSFRGGVESGPPSLRPLESDSCGLRAAATERNGAELLQGMAVTAASGEEPASQRPQAHGLCCSREEHAQTSGAQRCVTSPQVPWHLHRRPKGGAVVGTEQTRVAGRSTNGTTWEPRGAPTGRRSADRASASRGKTSADIDSPQIDGRSADRASADKGRWDR